MLVNILFFLLSIALTTAGLEFVLQAADYPRYPAIGWNWHESEYKSQRFVDDSVNQIGSRGQAIEYDDNDLVVLLVGDSQVEAGMQGQSGQPERILQAVLREYGLKEVKVFSLASAGWSLDQQYIALQEYFSKYRADVVVHWLTPRNDFWEAGNVDRSTLAVRGRLKPTFMIREDGSLENYQFPTFRYKLQHASYLAWDRVGGGNIGNSGIATRDYERYLPSARHQPVGPYDCPPFWEQVESKTAGMRSSGSFFTAKTEESLEESRSRFVPAIVPASARDFYYIELTHALQDEIEKLARAHTAAYVPFVWDDKQAAGHRVRCVMHNKTKKYYRVDPGKFIQLSNSNRTDTPLFVAKISHELSPYLSAYDRHLNLYGNYTVLSQVASKLFRVLSDEDPPIRTPESLMSRSGLLSRFGERIDFGEAGEANTSLQILTGFHYQDVGGRWTNGQGTIVFDNSGHMLEDSSSDTLAVLRLEGRAFLAGKRKSDWLEISVNGRRVARFELSQKTNGRALCAELTLDLTKRFTTVAIKSGHPARPANVTHQKDRRKLGYFVREVEISAISEGGNCNGGGAAAGKAKGL